MQWKRFADEMPPEREGVRILVGRVKTMDGETRVFANGAWRLPSSFDTTKPAVYWTHWLLVEPPAGEGV